MSVVLPIEEDLRYRIYTASAGQTQFAVSFPFQQDEDVTVALGGDPGIWQALSPTLYHVTGAGEPAGGIITFHAGRTLGDRILVLGEAILDRLGSVVADGRFNSRLTDDELDRSRLIQQETAREAGRALKMDFGVGSGLTVVGGIEDGRTLMKEGNRLVAGPDIVAEGDRATNAADLAQQYAANAAIVSGVNVPIYASRASAAGSTIAAAITAIETQFFNPSYADLATLVGRAGYRRVYSQPTHGMKFRSQDRFLPNGAVDLINGGWWENAEPELMLEMAGAIPANEATVAAAMALVAPVGRTIVLDQAEYRITPSSLPAKLRMRGNSQDDSRIRWIAPSGTSSMFSISGAVVDWQFENLTIDAARQSHLDPAAGYFAAIDVVNAGHRSSIKLEGVKFKNGRIIDVRVVGPTGYAESVQVTIKECHFLDGLLSTDALARAAQCISVNEGVDLLVEDCKFECAAPDGVTTFGRGGVIMQRPAGSTSLAWGDCIVKSNRFKNMGKAPANLGCVYIYSGHRSAIITGNYAEDVWGTAFSAKGDGGSINISNNTVHGQRHAASGVIGMVGQGDTYKETIGKNAIISGNTVLGAEGHCLFVDGQFADSDTGAASFEGVLIQGNTTIGGTRSLDLRNVNGAIIEGNRLKGALAAIFSSSPLLGTIRIADNVLADADVGIRLSGAMSTAFIVTEDNTISNIVGDAIRFDAPVRRFRIEDNEIDGCATAFVTSGSTDASLIDDNSVIGAAAAWVKSGSYGELYWGPKNRCNVDVSFAIRTLTIDGADAITPFMDWHYVAVASGSADNLITINGGREGQILRLFAATTGNVVTATTGGNIRLSSAGNFAMDNGRDMYVVMKRAAEWIEESRSNNG